MPELTSIILMCVSALLLVSSAYFLVRRNWFIRWVQGSAGLILLLISLGCFFAALSFYSFQSLTQEQTLAELEFRQLNEQYFHVTLTRANGVVSELELHGDLWQIDAQIIKWQGWVAAFGVMPVYRLGRIQGRYLSVEQERSAPRSVHALSRESPIGGFDLWQALNRRILWLPWLDARYGSATFLPMKDGARFELRLGATGLLSRPLNAVALQAMNGWQ